MYWHRLGNTFLTFLSNATTNLDLTDMETCYKVFRREVIQSIRLESNRFGIEPEITAKVARRGYRIYEVPISYYGREYWEGKKINWKDGFSAIWTILKYGLFDDAASEPKTYKTLRRLDSLTRYNRWIWERIEAFVGQRVLEVGAGSGTMTRFLYGRELVVATEKETAYLDRLRNRFRRKPGIIVERLDLDTTEGAELGRYGFDTITLINVLEHTADDSAALGRAFDLLQPGGRIIIFVPAGKELFGSLDRGVGHERRYERDELAAKLAAAGFHVDALGFQNEVARMAWWLNSRLFGRRNMPALQSKIFDRLVPVLKSIEGRNPSSGLSLIAIGRKALEAATPATLTTEAAITT